MKEKSLKELQIMMKIRSDYTVHYYSSWIENIGFYSKLYIQMEFYFNTLKGIMEQKLNDFKRKRFEVMNPLEYYISSELFIEILKAVSYLHKQNPPIIYTDLNPTKVLITEGLNGRFVKLCDFGLTVINECTTKTHTKYESSFVAPEVKIGRYYDMKADIFSLGVILQDVFNLDINK
jgi:serine/threonine protein kinase